jgi:hypothetical protein
VPCTSVAIVWGRAPWCGYLPDATMLSSSVVLGVAGCGGLVYTTSGELLPGRIQRPAAGTQGGGLGQEYRGRS